MRFLNGVVYKCIYQPLCLVNQMLWWIVSRVVFDDRTSFPEYVSKHSSNHPWLFLRKMSTKSMRDKTKINSRRIRSNNRWRVIIKIFQESRYKGWSQDIKNGVITTLANLFVLASRMKERNGESFVCFAA